jgi:hypothetical protein
MTAMPFVSIPVSDYSGPKFQPESLPFEPPSAEEELANIGALRRQLVTLELRLEDATDQLKDSRQWDLVQGLKEQRKSLQKQLGRAIDKTVEWAQPTMI